MKKRIVLVFLSIIISLLLCSCGTTPEAETQNTDRVEKVTTTSETEANDGELHNVPDEKIATDIIGRDDVQGCYSSAFAPSTEYKIATMEITKEQFNPDQKQDLVYCSVTIENDHFSVSFDAALEYNYYDRGGWIPDVFTMENKQATPIAPPDAELAAQALWEELKGRREELPAFYNDSAITLLYNSYSIGDFDLFIPEKSMAGLTMQISNPAVTATGIFYMSFWDNEWHFSTSQGNVEQEKSCLFYVKDYETSYNISDMCGIYEYWVNPQYLDQQNVNGAIEIHSINENKIEVTLHYFSGNQGETQELYDQLFSEVPVGQKVVLDFNPLTSNFVITYMWNSPFHLQYDPYTGAWSHEAFVCEFRKAE